MAFEKRLEFGNYTLKFGSKKVLIDLVEEIVMPSFEELRYVRQRKNGGHFFFLETQFVVLQDCEDEPVVGIAGKIVKNTKLRREQIYRIGKGLVADEGELESAPSSTFLLILNNHRLVFFRDMADAPTIKNFESTSRFCLKRRYDEFIKEKKEIQEEQYADGVIESRPTKKALREHTPPPELRITPLTDQQNLREFINRFSEINLASVKLLPTNQDELDNDDFWASVEKNRKSMGEKSRARIEYTSAKEGLDSGEVFEEAQSASKLANSEIRLRGADHEGDTIKGSNENFSLSVEVEDFPRDPSRAAQPAYTFFKRLVDAGQIHLPNVSMTVVERVRAILSRM